MITLPLGMIGVVYVLLLAKSTFGFMTFLGVISLFGIVINNAIVLIDRIEIERRSGRDPVDAIVEAGVRRLRPIVMTTCTTALGLAPIIIARDVLFYDLAVVISGGLIVGTLLTLIVAPCLFAAFFGTRDAGEAGRDASTAAPADTG